MKKTITILSLLFALPLLTIAHEFWLAPQKWRVQKGETVDIDIFVGEHFAGAIWGGNRSRVRRFTHFVAGGKARDLTPSVSTDSGQGVKVRFPQNGTQLLAFHSKSKFLELDAEKFNAYLVEDGLVNALTWRTKNNKLDTKGREFYQRCVKTLIQVGDKTTSVFKQNTGMPLEIIAEQNPYALKAGDSLTVKILYQNQPLVNALVRTWHKTTLKAETTEESLRSDKMGKIRFAIPTGGGDFMLSLVHMIHLTKNPKADWQSYWGSLTFGLN